MKKNLSNPDRIIRILLALVLGYLVYNNKVSGSTALVFEVVAAVLVFTSLVSFCPLYWLMKISSRRKEDAK